MDETRPKRRHVKGRSYEDTWLKKRDTLPDAVSYLPVGTKLAGYDQLGRVLVRYVIQHGNFAYMLARRKGVDATRDLVVSRRTLRTQRMGMAGIVQMYLYEEFVTMHQTKLLRDALWKAQDGEVVYDPRLSAETLAAIARDLGVQPPALDPELAAHAADRTDAEV